MHPSIAIGRSRLPRRSFLRSAGATALALPALELMGPTVGQSALAGATVAEPLPPPKRFVAICATLGFHGPFLFPDSPGANYQLTPYLKKLESNRKYFTVLSGFSHPEQQGNNGHASELTWLTSAMRPGLAGFRNTISLDQLIASKVGLQTRLPSLVLSTSGRSMSWTRAGVEIPGLTSPSKLFAMLFTEGSEAEKLAEIQRIRRGKSILDTVRRQTQELDASLGADDSRKLDQYLTSVRELEARLQQSEGWIRRVKPSVDAEAPRDVQEKNDAIARQRLMYDMVVLALQSDSTRTVTLQLSGMNAVPAITGVASDWHGLSHHGKDPSKIDELRIIEEAEFAVFNEFLSKLRDVREGDQTLLDNTCVLFGSNLGNASAHDWRNLPLLLAGGGFRHGGYLAHDAVNNTPLSNLFVAIAQQLGLELDSFGSSTSASVQGLDRA